MPSSYLCIKSKMKTGAKMKMSYEHNERIADVTNADHSRSHLNHDLIDLHGKDYVALSRERIAQMPYYNDHPVRKNAVRLLEVVLSYNRDKVGNVPQACPLDYDLTERNRWESTCLNWLEETFRDPTSGRSNVVAASVHYDETNPHIHAVISTEYNGRMNQTPYIGGAARLHSLQKSFGELMAKEFGLDAPIYGSTAQNVDLKRFQAELNAKIYDHEFPHMQAGESKEAFEERVADEIRSIYAAQFGKEKALIGELNQAKNLLRNPDRARNRELVNMKRSRDYYVRQYESVCQELKSRSDLCKDILSEINSGKNDADILRNIQILLQNEEFRRWLEEERRNVEEQTHNKREKRSTRGVTR